MKFVAEACAGELRSGSPGLLVGQICSDSRQAQAGDLFFAIAGNHFDGHDYLAEAARKGAVAVVAEHGRIPADLPCAVIAVDNPRKALGRLAERYRMDFTLPVIAVGGSNGKTTTKELLASVLRQKLKTLWSEASFNNDIGVPLTLLKLEPAHEAAVVEIGTNHPGELAPLVRMAKPGWGVITSIGREHLEFFGDVAGVATEEGWLAELLPADGRLVVNGDSEWTEQIAQRTQAMVIRVGLGTGNDWRASRIRIDGNGTQFCVETAGKDYAGEYRIGLLGRHQVVNALFAVAIGAELKVSRAEIEKGLLECRPVKMRMQLWDWNGAGILDDAYNANADSMLAALETLREMPCAGRRAAVLGDMAELGTQTRAAHEEAGRRAAQLGVDRLFAVGKMAAVTADAARTAGLAAADEFADAGAAAEAVKAYLRAGDVLLLKASRVTKLERLAEALRTPEPGGKM
ncbi:MAG TPA: UDP-N-acetylmuramoyl-tripeptide--D-alanyl-D-alanine ligase [Verrucomicrobiae bacterium]|nr:UDP-N-acetylmuramoyl-tripeptide--D-alanyl-D-alanine ligase [Verrucomicrobiae bacterium]